MDVDSRFSLSIGEAQGQKVLRFAAAADLILDEASSRLFSASFAELGTLCGMGDVELSRFSRDRERTIFSNGWQSWCFGGELGSGERVRRARIVPNINVYTDGPAPLEAAGEVRSYFFTYLRSGAGRLCLVSRGDPELATPPVAFRIDRSSLGLSAEVAARGARLAAGDLVAELRLFYREGYFAAKDAMADAFRDFRQFERLAFLGEAGAAVSQAPLGGTKAAPRLVPRLVPGGYESWYNHYTHIDDPIIAADLASIGANGNLINSYYLKRGKPTVFQIDDGWEAAVGQWEPDPIKFPRGMKAFASEIEERGMVPGLWLAPLLVTRSSAAFREKAGWLLRDDSGRPVPAGFNPGWDGVFYCLDISLPVVEEYLAALFEKVVEDWGYRYLKLDFLYAGFIPGSRSRPAVLRGGGAPYLHYDRIMRRITSRTTDSRGRGVAWLGCGAPLESSFRHFPLMRIGADTKEQWEDGLLKRVVRHQGRPAAYTNLTHTIGRALLDGTVFLNDPDVVFCRTSRMRLSESEKELVALIDALLASQIMFSDEAHEFGEAAEAAFTERVVGLYDRLSGSEFGAERLRRDLYSLFSRDDRFRGVANLSDEAFCGDGFEGYEPIAGRAARRTRNGSSVVACEPRSISLFERMGN